MAPTKAVTELLLLLFLVRRFLLLLWMLLRMSLVLHPLMHDAVRCCRLLTPPTVRVPVLLAPAMSVDRNKSELLLHATHRLTSQATISVVTHEDDALVSMCGGRKVEDTQRPRTSSIRRARSASVQMWQTGASTEGRNCPTSRQGQQGTRLRLPALVEVV